MGLQEGPVLSTHPGVAAGGASTQYSPWFCYRRRQYSPWWSYRWHSVLTLVLLQAGPVPSTHPGVATGVVSTQYSPWWGYRQHQYSVLTLVLLQAAPVLSTHPGVAAGGASTQYSVLTLVGLQAAPVLSTHPGVAAGGAVPVLAVRAAPVEPRPQRLRAPRRQPRLQPLVEDAASRRPHAERVAQLREARHDALVRVRRAELVEELRRGGGAAAAAAAAARWRHLGGRPGNTATRKCQHTHTSLV